MELENRLQKAIGEYDNLKMAFDHLEHQVLELSNSSELHCPSHVRDPLTP